MRNFFVYILLCSDGSFYTGHTDDLEKRMAEHNTQYYDCYTSKRLPVYLVYYAAFGARDEAIAAERQIKGWNHTKKQALVDNNFARLRELSKRAKK